MSRHHQGVALCLASAIGFGAMAIFAKLAFRHGATVTSLLTLRFGIAALVLWIIVRATRRPRLGRRGTLTGLGLGAIGYSAQAACYFTALRHLDASLTALLLCTYPAMVFVVAVALRRERATAIKGAALLLAGAGTALVLLGGGAGALNATGVALALGAALTYTTYILVADSIVGEADPLTLTATIATGAFASLLAFSVVTGRLDASLDPAGWSAIAGLTLVSTVGAATAFLLGLRRVGASTASIVSTVEPVVTVSLAALFFAERLGGVQIAGGTLVLAAVAALQLRPGTVRPGVAPDHAAPAPAARAVA